MALNVLGHLLAGLPRWPSPPQVSVYAHCPGPGDSGATECPCPHQGFGSGAPEGGSLSGRGTWGNGVSGHLVPQRHL